VLRKSKALATSEEELVARAGARDPAAIAAITAQHNRRLFRVARSILRDDDAAEDALQAAYLKAFVALPSFRGEASLGTWLTRIVINEANGLRRDRRTRQGLDRQRPGATSLSYPQAVTVDPEKGLAQHQIRVLLEQAIDRLPERLRLVLVARVLEDMDVEETAVALAITPATVKTRLHRARAALRAELERQVGPVLMNAFPFDGWRCRRMTELVLEGLGLASPAA
jgi:RNA polymerase sigma-70 factor (ECF subfamily)